MFGEYDRNSLILFCMQINTSGQLVTKCYLPVSNGQATAVNVDRIILGTYLCFSVPARFLG